MPTRARAATLAVVLLTGLATVGAAPAAAPGAGCTNPVTVHATYGEAAHNAVEPFILRVPDLVGSTQDGTVDLGGALVEVPECAESVQVAIIDDVWGPSIVAGLVCWDFVEEGRFVYPGDGCAVQCAGFGGAGGPVELAPVLAVFPGLPLEHRLSGPACGDDPSLVSVATSGGWLDPAGGIFLTIA